MSIANRIGDPSGMQISVQKDFARVNWSRFSSWHRYASRSSTFRRRERRCHPAEQHAIDR